MIAAITLVTLAVYLGTKEIARASESEIALRIARYLDVPIIPLLLLFVAVVAFSVLEIVERLA